MLAVPFPIAAVLNVLMLNADRFHLHREHVAGYGFLFGTPWAWLLDRGWGPDYHHHRMQLLFGYNYSVDSSSVVFKLPMSYGGEGGIPTHAILRYPTLSAVTKSLYLMHLVGLRRITKLAAAKNRFKSRRATQQT
jgi:hypothetical protein